MASTCRFLGLMLTIGLALPILAAEQDVAVTGHDGFELSGRLAYPDATDPAALTRVIVLLHGSGPQSMDEDLTAVTRDGKTNLFFKTVSDALVGEGFGVLRYNKRSYQCQTAAAADPSFYQSELFQSFMADPLNYFIEDAVAATDLARSLCPAAQVYLLGHSQGTYLALWLAHQDRNIAGVALVGFANSPLEALMLEQTVYRSLPYFTGADGNADGYLDLTEMSGSDPVLMSLRFQMGSLDLDQDSRISLDEFKAGNYVNLLLADPFGSAYRTEEARRPRPADAVKDLQVPVVFLQGAWDNQTPAYNVLAVQIANHLQWQKDNLTFHVFPGLGHALDHRDAYGDLGFDTIDPEALRVLRETLADRFR